MPAAPTARYVLAAPPRLQRESACWNDFAVTVTPVKCAIIPPPTAQTSPARSCPFES
jgi:hypothetical protein